MNEITILIEKYMDSDRMDEGNNNVDAVKLCQLIGRFIATSQSLKEISYLAGLLSICISGGMEQGDRQKVTIARSLLSRRK